MGLNTVDPRFESRLQKAYDEALQNGLWTNTYAGTNKEEYWAEGVQSWFDTNREHDSEHNHVNTRAELKVYDPALAKLLEDVFVDTEWRYTRATARTHMAHMQGFNPAYSPRFEWPPELMELSELHRELRNPDSDGSRRWTDLRRLDPGSVPRMRSKQSRREVAVMLVNGTGSEISFHWIDENGEEHRYGRVGPRDFETQSTYEGHVWLIKNASGRNLAAFRASGKLGRALVTSGPGTDTTPQVGELERLNPDLLSRLKSPGSRVETAIVFVNRTKSDVSYYWIDFEGKEAYYGSVGPGAEVTQHTYDGHIWVAKDANGTSLAVFRASEAPGRALITAAW